MAMACFRLVTFFPLPPDFSLPFFWAFTVRPTEREAFGLYFRADDFFAALFFALFFTAFFFAGAFFAAVFTVFFATTFFAVFFAAFFVAFFAAFFLIAIGYSSTRAGKR